MAEPARERASYAAYLALEQGSAARHEYVNGSIYAMAGGSPEHGRLGLNLGRLLGNALEGRPCVTLSSDVRVHVQATGRSTYPDLSVVCGRIEPAPGDPEAVTNPTVIVEVLSPSTEAADRGEKFAHYRRLPTLAEYVLVSQESPHIEVFRREGDAWTLTEVGAGQALALRSVGVTVSVDDVYRNPLAP